MDTQVAPTVALRLLEEVLKGQVEATEIQKDDAGNQTLRVLLNYGPQWYELKLLVVSALDVTTEDDAEPDDNAAFE